jgi:membrane protein YdbS with pleckstrin-like domain
MYNLTKHLRPNERVLWMGKPVKKAFVLPALGFVPFALFFLMIFLLIFYVEDSENFVGPHLLIPIALASGLILIPLTWQILRVRNTEYMITDQRVIIQSGAIGKDTRIFELGKIQEVSIKVGFIDRRFGTGSILILTAGQVAVGNIGGDTVNWQFGPLPKITPSISVIREPYKVQKLLQGAIDEAQTTQTL